jgi:hypothetical protein
MNTNINKLAKLAKQDDPILVTLVNRWMLDKNRTDPIPDIILKSRGIFWGFIGFLAAFGICLTGAWDWNHYHSIVVYNRTLGVIYGIQSFVGLFASWTIHRIKKKICNEKNADDFCSAISLIERIYIEHGAALDMWQDELKIASTAGKSHFNSMTGQLEKLEKVSWRREDAKKFRERFHKEIHLLHALLLIPNDCREYFEPKPEQPPSPTVHEIFEKGALTAH